MTFQSKVINFCDAIIAMKMPEYLDMVEYFHFGYATKDRTEIQECIPIWDMACELAGRGYRLTDLYNEGYKYIPQYCPLL